MKERMRSMFSQSSILFTRHLTKERLFQLLALRYRTLSVQHLNKISLTKR